MNYWKIFSIIFAILYLISPFDIIPDFIPIGGWLDDALLMGILIYYLTQRRVPRIFQWRGRPSTDAGQDRRWFEWAEGFNRQKTHQGPESKAQTEPKDPYEILGVQPGANQEEIRAAYRRAAQAYHPDKVSHLGPELQELAQTKFIEIQEAYEKLMGKKN